MTTLAFGNARRTRSAQPPGRRFEARTLLGPLAQAWTGWLARRAMGQLDDEALHDIGIGRSEIASAVQHGRGARPQA